MPLDTGNSFTKIPFGAVEVDIVVVVVVDGVYGFILVRKFFRLA